MRAAGTLLVVGDCGGVVDRRRTGLAEVGLGLLGVCGLTGDSGVGGAGLASGVRGSVEHIGGDGGGGTVASVEISCEPAGSCGRSIS